MPDDLSLLFRLRADNSQAKAGLADTRAAISQLRTSSSSDFRQMQSATTGSLGSITQSLSGVSSQIPIVGNAFTGLAGQLGTMTTASEGVATGFVAMAGPIGVAVSVTLLAAGASASLAKALFDVTKQAAEFQGKMFDLSQQTGVNVETLSALEILAKTTGGTIESIAQSLVIFQGKLDEAQDASSKAGKQFEELGISTNNTEDAFRDALTQLAKMPEGFHQTNEAAELFGRRGGKQVLAILKETNGDLDGAIRRFREMGILISDADAKLADEFNDQLAVLGFQLRALGATIGKEVLPVALGAIESLSKALKDNKETIEAVGVVAKVVASAFTDQLNVAIFAVTETWNVARPTLEAIAAVYERIAKAVQTLSGGLPAIALPSDIGSVQGTLTGRRDVSAAEIAREVEEAARKALEGANEVEKARKEAAVRTNKAIALSLQALEEITRVHVEDLERERERDLKNIDEWETESLQIAHDHRVGLEAIYDEEAASVRKYIDNKADQYLALQEVEQKRTKAVNDEIKKRNEIEDKAQRQRDQVELNLEKQLAAIRDSAREGEIAKIKDALDRQAIVESEAIARELALLKDAHEQRILLIDIESKLETTTAARKVELDNERIISEQRYTDEKERLTQQRIDAANREAATPGAGGIAVADDPFAGIGKKIEDEIGPPPDLQPHIDVFNTLRETGMFAMQGLAQGVAQLTQAWILYGNAGPNAMRKMVASVLSGVAAQAAVMAIMELAYGIAALTPWGAAIYGPAPFHFKSAALFGAIALTAAVVGRAVAGDAFTKSPGGGDGGGGDAGTTEPKKPPTVKEEWRQQAQPVHIHLHGEAAEAFNYKVIKVVKDDVAIDGPMRRLIVDVAGG